MRKTDMEGTRVTLSHAMQAAYFLSVVLQPFMPSKSSEMLKLFGIESVVGWDKALKPLEVSTRLHKIPILFKKLEAES